MDSSEQSRFNDLYQRHLRMLKLQGKSDKTIDVYARAVPRASNISIVARLADPGTVGKSPKKPEHSHPQHQTDIFALYVLRPGLSIHTQDKITARSSRYLSVFVRRYFLYAAPQEVELPQSEWP